MILCFFFKKNLQISKKVPNHKIYTPKTILNQQSNIFFPLLIHQIYFLIAFCNKTIKNQKIALRIIGSLVMIFRVEFV